MSVVVTQIGGKQ